MIIWAYDYSEADKDKRFKNRVHKKMVEKANAFSTICFLKVL